MLNKFDFSPLYLAILNDNFNCGEFLIDLHVKLFYSGTPNQRDCSPIFLAIRKPKNDWLSQMVDSDEHVDIQNS
jgi:hypothetical protein